MFRSFVIFSMSCHRCCGVLTHCVNIRSRFMVLPWWCSDTFCRHDILSQYVARIFWIRLHQTVSTHFVTMMPRLFCHDVLYHCVIMPTSWITMTAYNCQVPVSLDAKIPYRRLINMLEHNKFLLNLHFLTIHPPKHIMMNNKDVHKYTIAHVNTYHISLRPSDAYMSR